MSMTPCYCFSHVSLPVLSVSLPILSVSLPVVSVSLPILSVKQPLTRKLKPRIIDQGQSLSKPEAGSHCYSPVPFCAA